MKKVILCLIIALNVSCKDHKPKTIEAPEYPKPFKLLYTDRLEVNTGGIVLGSDNHEYLVTDYDSYGENVEHYIDCKLCQSRINQKSK